MLISVLKRLGDVAEIMTGMTGFDGNGSYQYKVVQPNNFGDDGVMDGVELQRRNDELSEKQLLMPGDILVKRLNPSFVHVVTNESSGMVASQNLLVVRPGEAISPFYLGFLLEQKEILGQIEHVTGSAAAIKAISVKKLAGTSIPVVPIAEQHGIGELWKLSRVRKKLLKDYLVENDRLMSVLASQILNFGGNKK